MKSSKGLSGILITSALGLVSVDAHAALCSSYAGVGELFHDGTTTCYVWDPADIDNKFGSPSFSGDTIFFTPNNFKAESTNTDGAVLSGGVLNIQIIAKDGFVLNDINVGEIGDYQMSAGATGTSVDVDAWMRVFDWFDPTPVFGTDETQNLAITGPLNIADGNKHDWSAAGSFDLSTAKWDDRNHVGFTLQNDLEAVSTVFGESAMIQKKASGISVLVDTTPVIPVPAAIWLFTSGLIGLIGFARRKN